MSEHFEITLHQSRLMRHALGLDYKKKSFRNRYLTSEGNPNYKDWMKLVNAGFARTWKVASGDYFAVTLAGAKEVLQQRESLCKEDFPEQG